MISFDVAACPYKDMICVSLHRFGVGLGAIQSLGDIMEIVFGNKVKEETFKFIYLCIFYLMSGFYVIHLSGV